MGPATRPDRLSTPVVGGPILSDIAQGTMPSTETGTDPIGEFAAHRAVGVVHADEANDPLEGCCVGGTHHDSIADRVPTMAVVASSPQREAWAMSPS